MEWIFINIFFIFDGIKIKNKYFYNSVQTDNPYAREGTPNTSHVKHKTAPKARETSAPSSAPPMTTKLSEIKNISKFNLYLSLYFKNIYVTKHTKIFIKYI